MAGGNLSKEILASWWGRLSLRATVMSSEKHFQICLSAVPCALTPKANFYASSCGSPGGVYRNGSGFPLQAGTIHGFANSPSIPNPANIMKRPFLAMASASGLSCLILGSCNPQDPSAVRETQKMIAEATAKASRLEQENTSLKSQMEDLQKQVSVAKATAETTPKKGFTEDELDKKLGATVAKLRDQLTAMDKKLDLLKAETEKSVALNEDRARNSSPVANPAVARTNLTSPQADRGRAAQPPQVKVQPAPEPPRSKYDIKLDRPVMGPASH